MKDVKSLEDYDIDLFNIYKLTFSTKYPDIFSNKKLYNTWGRKCNFIIKSLKNIILTKEKEGQILNTINLLIEFLSEEDTQCGKNSLQYLSCFNNDFYKEHINEMLEFRNGISSCIFTFISCHEENKKNDIPSIQSQIEEFLNYFLLKYEFLKSLYNIVEYSLDSKEANICEQFLLILKSNDFEKKILENKHCTLDTKQKAFLSSNKLNLSQSVQYLNNLKSNRLSNEELIEELKNKKDGKKNSKNAKKKKAKKVSNNNIIEVENKKFENSSPINNISNNNNNLEKIENEKKNPNISVLPNGMIDNIDINLLLEKIDSLEKEKKSQLQEIENMKKLFEEKDKLFEERIIQERKRNQKIVDNLENRIDICKAKIGMIWYRDLIKDIISYSYDFFKLPKDGETNLWNKIKRIKNKISLSNKVDCLNSNEKKNYGYFIHISYLTLKNVNHNIHEGGYVSNYSINNFIDCLKDYLDLYLMEILDGKNNKKLQNLFPLFQNLKVLIKF